MKTTVIGIAMMASAAAIAAPASAAMVLNGDGSVTVSGAPGGSVDLYFDGFGGDPAAVVDGLSAMLTLNFVNQVGGVYTFSYTMTNTSGAPITNSRISGFGFDSGPNINVNGGTAVSGPYDVVGKGNVPNHGDVEFCVKAGGGTNNCAGGGGGGVGFGSNAGGTFTLNYGSAQPSLTFDRFFVRYQSIAGAGNVTSAIGRQVPPVPEPSTWAMMLLGFGFVGSMIRRRRKALGGLMQIA